MDSVIWTTRYSYPRGKMRPAWKAHGTRSLHATLADSSRSIKARRRGTSCTSAHQLYRQRSEPTSAEHQRQTTTSQRHWLITSTTEVPNQSFHLWCSWSRHRAISSYHQPNHKPGTAPWQFLTTDKTNFEHESIKCAMSLYLENALRFNEYIKSLDLYLFYRIDCIYFFMCVISNLRYL